MIPSAASQIQRSPTSAFPAFADSHAQKQRSQMLLYRSRADFETSSDFLAATSQDKEVQHLFIARCYFGGIQIDPSLPRVAGLSSKATISCAFFAKSSPTRVIGLDPMVTDLLGNRASTGRFRPVHFGLAGLSHAPTPNDQHWFSFISQVRLALRGRAHALLEFSASAPGPEFEGYSESTGLPGFPIAELRTLVSFLQPAAPCSQATSSSEKQAVSG